MSDEQEPTAKIVGIGNRYRGDDAVGLEVIDLLKQSLPANCLASSDGEITALLSFFEDHDHVVIVDAVQMPGEVGTIVRLDGCRESLGDTGLRSSTHAMGLAEAVEMARNLQRLPRRLTIFGIVGAQFDNSEGMSPAVVSAARQLADELSEEYSHA